MSDDIKQRLDALKRELERQDEEWERVKERIARLGDIELSVPSHVLLALEDACNPTSIPVNTVRPGAIRV